ncbi:MAG: SagB/ThcOx family dehydrogenase [Chloroflexota bacterium]
MRRPPASRSLSALILSLLLALPVSAACAARTGIRTQTPQAAPPTVIALPPPRLEGPLSLEACLLQRRSIREFTDQALTLEEIGQLLWAAQGITDPRGFRTAPSAGALYPLEIYVVRAEGVTHYDPAEHALAAVKDGDLRHELSAAALGQQAVAQAPLVLVITAVYERTEAKYGAERAPRYVQLEAGHAGQNILLQAVALGLGAVPIGAFDDGEVQRVLGLPADHLPLYLIPVGHPG